MSMNYYADLGLERGASIEEVRVAFRSQAMECHPDVDGSPEARERFERITKAYRELSGGNREDDLDFIDLGLSVGNIAFRSVCPSARLSVPPACLFVSRNLPGPLFALARSTPSPLPTSAVIFLAVLEAHTIT